MPIYDFLNEETGEFEKHMMKIADLDKFKEENPQLKQMLLGAPRIVGGTGTSFKNDDGWNENLARIAESHPGSALANKVGGRSSKQVKVEEAAKKHGLGNKSYTMDL
jgi:hypothetical protein